ncbi:uncharacterized protein LOC111385023 isoform X2 [Olea europaea var. sylvestris]|uniref:uncharacterized protein LOC111385023 isoform X2 n=1 Tax=Olea europaea var. sylvestris TaxID=158386 RepID=UPI000C1D1B05|nr:uncharacterized protein LOC111385023 isoform X2 [Olea europaea var. sylvestris]
MFVNHKIKSFWERNRMNFGDKLMDSIQCSALCNRLNECRDACDYVYDEIDYIQNKLETPMPWIGMYIAAASVLCSLAMAADAFHGFQSKRLWFPCKN